MIVLERGRRDVQSWRRGMAKVKIQPKGGKAKSKAPAKTAPPPKQGAAAAGPAAAGPAAAHKSKAKSPAAAAAGPAAAPPPGKAASQSGAPPAPAQAPPPVPKAGAAAVPKGKAAAKAPPTPEGLRKMFAKAAATYGMSLDDVFGTAPSAKAAAAAPSPGEGATAGAERAEAPSPIEEEGEEEEPKEVDEPVQLGGKTTLGSEMQAPAGKVSAMTAAKAAGTDEDDCDGEEGEEESDGEEDEEEDDEEEEDEEEEDDEAPDKDGAAGGEASPEEPSPEAGPAGGAPRPVEKPAEPAMKKSRKGRGGKRKDTQALHGPIDGKDKDRAWVEGAGKKLGANGAGKRRKLPWANDADEKLEAKVAGKLPETTGAGKKRKAKGAAAESELTSKGLRKGRTRASCRLRKHARELALEMQSARATAKAETVAETDGVDGQMNSTSHHSQWVAFGRIIARKKKDTLSDDCKAHIEKDKVAAFNVWMKNGQPKDSKSVEVHVKKLYTNTQRHRNQYETVTYKELRDRHDGDEEKTNKEIDWCKKNNLIRWHKLFPGDEKSATYMIWSKMSLAHDKALTDQIGLHKAEEADDGLVKSLLGEDGPLGGSFNVACEGMQIDIGDMCNASEEARAIKAQKVTRKTTPPAQPPNPTEVVPKKPSELVADLMDKTLRKAISDVTDNILALKQHKMVDTWQLKTIPDLETCLGNATVCHTRCSSALQKSSSSGGNPEKYLKRVLDEVTSTWAPSDSWLKSHRDMLKDITTKIGKEDCKPAKSHPAF